MFLKRSVETPALDHDNNIHEYDILRILRHVRYCAFIKKKLSEVAQ